MAILRKIQSPEDSDSLLYSGAGSLIHPSVVLSATNKYQPNKLDVIRAGEWDFGANNEPHPHQDRYIDDIYVFGDNTGRHANTVEFDSVQLIFVKEPFVLSPNVATVCLPPPSSVPTPIERNGCITAAWGQQSCSRTRGLSSVQSLTELIMLPNRWSCASSWQNYLEDRTFTLRDYYFCTKRTDKIVWDESCFCDHGSALMCPINEGENVHYEQVGVALTTEGCKRELPGKLTTANHY